MKISDILSKKYNISKRLAKRYIKDSLVTFRQRVIKNDFVVSSDINETQISLNIKENKMLYDISRYLIFKSDKVIFFYKPPFMHTQRLKPTDDFCISDIIDNELTEFRLISRLDYETDGVVGAVRNNYKPINVLKKYRAWVHGRVDKYILFDRKIDANKKKKVSVLDEIGDNQLKIYPVKVNNLFTLVEIQLSTAHRHQIRASLAFLGFPIVGDKLYGYGDYKRLLLQCFYTSIDDFFINLDLVMPDLGLDSLENFQ